jgi:hypothetical protein
LLIGYFEGLDSERGIAWRAADSLALRAFLGLGLTEMPPDHSTISRTRRLIDLETHQAVFTWVLQVLAGAGLVRGKTHAVDMETGAVVAVTLHGADQGDTATIQETVPEAAEQLAAANAADKTLAIVDEVVADKGYHSNQTLVDLAVLGVRTYIAEPDRGRRRWRDQRAARDAVYANRRRLRGPRGQALMRQRGERLERPVAHLYRTGALRRTHLRGRSNILKRLLVHSSALNLGLMLRRLLGVGTPRGLQGRMAAVLAPSYVIWRLVKELVTGLDLNAADAPPPFTPHRRHERPSIAG